MPITQKIVYTRRTIAKGVRLDPNRAPFEDYFQKRDFYMIAGRAPVAWHGKRGEMFFSPYRTGNLPINYAASKLVPKSSVFVRGSAFVVTGEERMHCLRVEESAFSIWKKISKLRLAEPQRVSIKPYGRWNTHRNVYVGNDADAAMIKMVLSQ